MPVIHGNIVERIEYRGILKADSQPLRRAPEQLACNAPHYPACQKATARIRLSGVALLKAFLQVVANCNGAHYKCGVRVCVRSGPRLP